MDFSFLSEDERTPNEIIWAFDEYAIGETNKTYERYVLHTEKQKIRNC